MKTLQKIEEATQFLLNKGLKPDIAIILGTGLGNEFIKKIEIELELDYSEIPHFPISSMVYLYGKLIYGTLSEKKIMAFQGRFHYYEGYSMEEICFPVRISKFLGAKFLLLSNAAGSINSDWNKGDLMLIEDHINLQPGNPLISANEEKIGSRFPDMIEPYSKYLNSLIIDIARQEQITLRQGVYVAVAGPMLETRAEYRFMRTIGADAVGMSTVPEIIAAVHAGIPACAISVLTDDCDPDNLQPINIPEILRIAGEAEPKLTKIFIKLIERLNT